MWAGEGDIMTSKLLTIAIMAGGSMFAQPRVSVGFGYSSPAYGSGYVQSGIPACPGPDYEWVNGYWVHQPQYSYRAAPRYERRRYEGRWENNFRERGDASRGGFSQGFRDSRQNTVPQNMTRENTVPQNMTRENQNMTGNNTGRQYTGRNR
jgi:hypothetical protein